MTIYYYDYVVVWTGHTLAGVGQLFTGKIMLTSKSCISLCLTGQVRYVHMVLWQSSKYESRLTENHNQHSCSLWTKASHKDSNGFRGLRNNLPLLIERGIISHSKKNRYRKGNNFWLFLKTTIYIYKMQIEMILSFLGYLFQF